MRRSLQNFLATLAVIVFIAPAVLWARSAEHKGPHVSASKALKLLREGNNRFVSGRLINAHTSKSRRNEVINGQEPFATILGCADSRVPIERVFDHGFGDLFVIRSAGNFFEGANLVGSAEYGVLHAHTNLILVLGHQHCGAVGAALKGPGKMDKQTHIPNLLEYLKPGIDKAKQTTLTGSRLYKEAIEQNVFASMANLLNKSLKISRMVAGYTPDGLEKLAENKKVMLVGGVYSLENGRVEFLGRHPDQADLLIQHIKPYKKK